MPRNKFSSGIRGRTKASNNELEEQDKFVPERKILQEEVSVTKRGKPQKMSRLKAFVEKEAQRAAQADPLATKILDVLIPIIKKNVEAERKIEYEPGSHAARVEKQTRINEMIEPALAYVGVKIARMLAEEFSIGRTTPVQPIKLYYIGDEAWKIAEDRIDKAKRKAEGKKGGGGYKNPPAQHQFKGSGNPRGRPPKVAPWRSILDAIEEPIVIRTAIGEEERSRRGVIFLGFFNKAMSGDAASRRWVLKKIVEIDDRNLLLPLLRKRRRLRNKLVEKYREQINNVYNLAIASIYEYLYQKYESRYGSSGVVEYPNELATDVAINAAQSQGPDVPFTIPTRPRARSTPAQKAPSSLRP